MSDEIRKRRENRIKSTSIIENIPDILTTHSASYTEYLVKAIFERITDGIFLLILNSPIKWFENNNEEKLKEIFTTQKVSLANKRAHLLNQIFSDSIIGRTPKDIFADDFEGGLQAWRKLFDSGRLDVILPYKALSGDQIWMEYRFKTLFDESGAIAASLCIMRDVTDRETYIQTEKNRICEFQSFFENYTKPAINFDFMGRIYSVNRGFEELLGCKFEQISGSNMFEILQIEDEGNKLDLEIITKDILSLGSAVEYKDNTQLSYEGNIIPVKSILFTPQVSLDGSLTSYCFTVEDVKTESDFSDLETALNSISAGYWEFNLETGDFKVTENLFRLYGVTTQSIDFSTLDLENFYGNIAGMVVEKDRLKVEEAYSKYFSDFTPYDINFGLNVNGVTKKIHSKSEVILNSKGLPLKFFGIVQDITTLIQEPETSNSDFLLADALEQLPASVIITGLDGAIIYVNREFEKITGYSKTEVTGKSPSILKSGKLLPAYYDRIWKTIKAGDTWTGEILNKKKNGDLYWESGSIAPLRNGKGEVTHYFSVKEDITKRKNSERELKSSKIKLEESNKLKSSLLRNLNHEIRTPLHGIIGLTNFLSNEIENDDHKLKLKDILASSNRLMKTLDSLIDFSILESDSYAIIPTTVNLTSLMTELTEKFKESVSEKGLFFEILINEGITVYSDRDLIEKAFLQLLDNAIKFTSEGTISISLFRDDSNNIVVKITDTGIGMKKEDLALVFNEFKQTSEGISRSYEGTGLGLALTKKIVEILGCKIRVESIPGKGTTFTILFKETPALTKQDVKEVEPVESEIKESKRTVIKTADPVILLVEDNRINSDVISLFLKRFCGVERAKNGLEALKFASQKQYSIVLLDINLGEGLNGVEVLKELRKIDGYSSVPVIALTGYSTSTDKTNFLTEGFDYYFSKPLEMEKFVKFIKLLLGV
ncbi:MAG: PAS domain S-box protein [Ignavibacteriaceae bacterium]|nr:PAS domain S-box protein [Ignavibacteriaceae bacterium]